MKQETNNAILTGAINLRNDIIALWGGQTGSTTGTGTGSTYTGPANSGLTPTEDMVYYRQAGATAASRTQQRRTASDGMTISVSMVGRTDSQIVTAATQVFHKELSRTLAAAKQKQARAL